MKPIYHYIEFIYKNGGHKMKKKSSRIADEIMNEYYKKKKYEEKIKKELEKKQVKKEGKNGI